MGMGPAALKVASGGITVVLAGGAVAAVAADQRPGAAPLKPPAGHGRRAATAPVPPQLLINLATPVDDGYGGLSQAQAAALGEDVIDALHSLRHGAAAADIAVIDGVQRTLAAHGGEARSDALPIAVDALAAAPSETRRRLVNGVLAWLPPDSRLQLTALLHIQPAASQPAAGAPPTAPGVRTPVPTARASAPPTAPAPTPHPGGTPAPSATPQALVWGAGQGGTPPSNSYVS